MKSLDPPDSHYLSAAIGWLTPAHPPDVKRDESNFLRVQAK
ncbi:MAG: hypothetical protein ACLQU4_15130 [Limisphaerales bacterium]